jgi:hypothetical protein
LRCSRRTVYLQGSTYQRWYLFREENWTRTNVYLHW